MANYAVIRMEKYKKDRLNGTQKHNQREFQKSKNENIDRERTHLNYDLVNEKPISYSKAIHEKIEGRVKRKVRADAVLVSEFLITASPDYMNGLSDAEQRRYFETAVDHLKEKYSAENMLYATVHMDEATPHMHVGIVPITEDGRLSAKDFFNGKLKMKAIQDDFHRHMVENGFDLVRGEPSEKKHENVHQYKINQRQAELERLNAEIALKEKQREELEKQNKAVQAVIEVKKESLTAKAGELKMPTIEHEKAMFKKNKVIVPEPELHALYAYAEQKTKTAAELARQLKSETQEKERWQSIARQEADRADEKDQRLQELQSKIHSEVEASKKEIRRKLAKEFTEEQREDLRQEVKEELTTLRTENEELSAENKVLIIERNREAEESLKLKQELDKRNGQYAKLFDLAKNQQQSLEKVVGENKALKKENGTLKERVAVLEQWKDKMVQWAKEKLPKVRRLAVSFFTTAGMRREAAKYKDNELER
ncbi:plasmid recombination protein [Bacillus atrophaeus]|uniref:MobV family relaxase n=1 Tax=Bacillus atrophaeus TaxID=1452 RepID=UPI000D060F9B|nr:MobV family relaxase [Bacillus atrophaeus]PSA88743.1 plasmid recombination protein [Bacillus atrophaeus]